jgi:hypothetical protein
MKRIWQLIGLAVAVCGVAALLGTASASGASSNCTGTVGAVTLNGNVTAGPGCDLEGTTVTGNVSVKAGGSLTTNGASIGGNLEIQNNGAANSICNTSIGGNLLIHNNSGTTSVGYPSPPCYGNSVSGNTDIHNNSGQVTIAHTDVGGNLDCHENSPAASTGNGGNTVGGKAKGECTKSLTVSCPATGCDAATSDGNTDVDVNVPGGGKAGKLTITLGPPPADDGCDSGGEGGPPPSSGDVVTIVPPGGYTESNPIVADITFNQSFDLFEICKSNNGKAPFTALPECSFSEDSESSAPSNVPCWVNITDFESEGPSEALVYMTSVDPAVNGHS